MARTRTRLSRASWSSGRSTGRADRRSRRGEAGRTDGRPVTPALTVVALVACGISVAKDITHTHNCAHMLLSCVGSVSVCWTLVCIWVRMYVHTQGLVHCCLPPCRDHSVYGNIMYDRRIVRGNTYALHTLPAVSVCMCAHTRSCVDNA